jgi:DNA-directed RNA polymerase specialized sigma24 family protein
MSINPTATLSPTLVSSEEIALFWHKFSPRLQMKCRRLVYSFHVPAWRGQEEDIIQDILQETARRIIERLQKAVRGEATSPYAFEPMVAAIAQNYCRDMRRRDRRLLRIISDESESTLLDSLNTSMRIDPTEMAIESTYQENLFTQLAQDIVRFPCKQRQALLIDLANRMSFETQPTPLQRAFLDVGIQIKDYRRQLPVAEQERKRHAALLGCAYKRVARLAALRQLKG